MMGREVKKKKNVNVPMKTLGVLNAQEILKWIKLCTLYKLQLCNPPWKQASLGYLVSVSTSLFHRSYKKKSLCSQLHHMTLSDLAAS